MTNQQKEGVIVVAFTILVAGSCSVLSDWGQYTFFQADVGLNSLSFEIGDAGNTQEIFPLRFKLANVLYLLSVPLAYGVLRATAIVKRLFSFESALARLLPENEE